jgi:hypothetical protein
MIQISFVHTPDLLHIPRTIIHPIVSSVKGVYMGKQHLNTDRSEECLRWAFLEASA